MKFLYLLFQFIFYFNISKTQLLINSISPNNKGKTFMNNNKRNLDINHGIYNIVIVNADNMKQAYISSSKNENGDIYLISNSDEPSTSNGFVYIIKTDYTYESKSIPTHYSIENKYPLMTIIKLEDVNKEYLITFSHEGLFELISFHSGKIFSCPLSLVNSGNSFIMKNTFTSLKYYNNQYYVLNAFIDRNSSNFMIQKLYFQHPDISINLIENEEKIVCKAFKNSSVTCFEIGNYIECLYTNLELFYTVSIFEISTLNILHTEVIDENVVQFGDLFSKCIYFKNNVGAFMYFYEQNQFPKMQLKKLDINENEFKLSNYTERIYINSISTFSLNSHYIYNDIIKTTDNNIFYINTIQSSIEIFIVWIKFLNDDKNIILKYYREKINEYYNTAICKDITTFSFKGLLGIGITNYNFNLGDNVSYSSYLIIGYLNLNAGIDDINIYISNDRNIFSEENNYNIKINDIINSVVITNNIFYYIIEGIKIVSDLNETKLGFYIYSNKTENKVNQNELILDNDTISFIMVSDIGVSFGNHSIEYEIIIKEPEYDNFISGIVEYYPKNDIDASFREYYKADYLSTRKGYIYFSVNECHKTCESCKYYGDDLNHHCDICSEQYPFSLSIINGNNCYEECPKEYTVIDNNICIKNKDIVTEIITENFSEDITDISTDKSTEIISELKTSVNSEGKIEKNTELLTEYKTNLVFEKNTESKTELITERNNGITQEIINENNNSHKENIIRENNCKKLFYVDENFKINCIDGDFCTSEYPFLDKTIKNMCTNCLVKYKNKCYTECPENTCIKQDKYLDQCIDINDDTKVINKICFENFKNLTNNIKEMSENNVIIKNGQSLTAYAYEIEQDINYFEENKLTYINFDDIKETLIKEFNLDKDSKIYALIVDSPTKYSNSSINDYGFILLLENGTELNLSNLSEDIMVNVSIPISNLELANYNYALIFSEQGYDIYNKNSSFYHDICTPGYIDDNDITLEERKKEIFPNNIATSKSNCIYHSTNLNNKRFSFNCSLSGINVNNTNNNVENNFDGDKEKISNYFLDMINYKVLNCSKLFFNIDNYRHNKAVMICTTSIFLSIFFLILFFCYSLPKIRITMFNDIPTDKKIRELFFDQIEKQLIYNRQMISTPVKKCKTNIFKNHVKKRKKNAKIEKRKTNFSMVESKNILYSKESYVNSNESKGNTSKNIKIVCNSKKIEENSIEYDCLPFKMAIYLDKRNGFKIFGNKLTEKIKIIDICVNKKIKDILLSQYFLYLLSDLTMNAILYSDHIVSHKRHNNGRLDYIVVFLLSAFSNIFAGIIDYYLELLIGFEDRINDIKEIKKEIAFLRVSKLILREIKIRVILFFIIENVIIILCTYYMFIFFTIYHKSQMSLLKNYLISLIEGWSINILIALLIVIFRKLGIYFRNKYIYNTSKYIDKNF